MLREPPPKTINNALVNQLKHQHQQNV